MYISLKRDEWLGNSRNDLFAGLVSSIAVLPEVVGFAIVAGVNPVTALLASTIMLLVITFFGGRPAMVTAAAGSMALVVAPLIQQYGIEYMIASTLLTGIFQLVLGFLGVHRLMRFIPKTVMLGFVNALAILIFMSQVTQLPGQTIKSYIMVAITVLMMFILPKFIKVLPPALIAIVIMTVYSYISPTGFQTIGDLGDLASTSLSFSLPSVPLSIETLKIITPTAAALTMVGLVETLLTIPIVDKMAGGTGDSQQEVKAQGLANILTGFVGGAAGCAMIGQAVINCKSGGRKRLSTLVSALSLLLLLFVFRDVMLQIPTAVLIGIMMVVAYDTFDWGSLSLFHPKYIAEAFILIVTTAAIVVTSNLAVGIIIGVILSAILLVIEISHIKVELENHTYYVKSPVFFASTTSFLHYFQNIAEHTPKGEKVTIDFSESVVVGLSASEALEEIKQAFIDHGIEMEMRNLIK